MKDKIEWNKPDYKNQFVRINNREIDRLCLTGGESGDIKIEKEKYGRKIKFYVYRLEKVGEQVRGVDTLTRTEAIEELRKMEKDSHLP